MDIDYDYYRIFYYVAKCGSITQAAKRLLHDQPNLTRMIKLLEGELGCALFYRTNRGVRLTPEGERLYVHVKAAFEQIEAGERELAARRNLEQGEVAIAASMVALRCVLLPVLRTFRERYPGVRIHVENSTAPQASAAIREGSADLAVVTAPARVPESLIAVPLRKIRDVAVCGSAFPELTGRRVSLKELNELSADCARCADEDVRNLFAILHGKRVDVPTGRRSGECRSTPANGGGESRRMLPAGAFRTGIQSRFHDRSRGGTADAPNLFAQTGKPADQRCRGCDREIDLLESGLTIQGKSCIITSVV